MSIMAKRQSRNDRPTSLQYHFTKQTAVSQLATADQQLPSVSINPPATNSQLKSFDDIHNKQLSKPSNTPSDVQTLTPTTTKHSFFSYKKFSTESNDSGCQSQVSSVTSLQSHSKETSGSNLHESCQILRESPVTEDPSKESAPQLITEPGNNGAKKVSVDETALSNLFKAVLKLQEGALLLAPRSAETDGPYYRRRSTGEGGSKVKDCRRVSSQAYFHSMVNVERSPNNWSSRRTSGCIVCDRKRKPTIDTPPPSTKVIIKTSMSRKAQQTRRFSEALQVIRCSQSTLPYVELYVLNREELMKLRRDYKPILKLVPFDEPREKVLERCVSENMPDFIHYTDWPSITCYLVAKRLLSKDDRQKMLSVPTRAEKGNCFYLDVLPTKGDDAYCRLYDCIKGEQEHSGHEHLIKILDSALQ